MKYDEGHLENALHLTQLTEATHTRVGSRARAAWHPVLVCPGFEVALCGSVSSSAAWGPLLVRARFEVALCGSVGSSAAWHPAR